MDRISIGLTLDTTAAQKKLNEIMMTIENISKMKININTDGVQKLENSFKNVSKEIEKISNLDIGNVTDQSAIESIKKVGEAIKENEKMQLDFSHIVLNENEKIKQSNVGVEESVEKVGKEVGETKVKVRGLGDEFSGLVKKVSGLFIFQRIARHIVSVRKEFDGLRTTLLLASGSMERVAVLEQRLIGLSVRTGSSTRQLATNYELLSTSLAGTSIQGAQLERLFENVTFMTASLNLNNEQQRAVFSSLERIFGSGQLDRQQLSQLRGLLPNIIAPLTEAFGVREVGELSKIHEKIGNEGVRIKTVETFEKTRDISERAIGRETFERTQKRFETSLKLFIDSFDEITGATKFLQVAFSRVGDVFTFFAKKFRLFTAQEKLSDAFSSQEAIRKLNAIVNKEGLTESENKPLANLLKAPLLDFEKKIGDMTVTLDSESLRDLRQSLRIEKVELEGQDQNLPQVKDRLEDIKAELKAIGIVLSDRDYFGEPQVAFDRRIISNADEFRVQETVDSLINRIFGESDSLASKVATGFTTKKLAGNFDEFRDERDLNEFAKEQLIPFITAFEEQRKVIEDVTTRHMNLGEEIKNLKREYVSGNIELKEYNLKIKAISDENKKAKDSLSQYTEIIKELLPKGQELSNILEELAKKFKKLKDREETIEGETAEKPIRSLGVIAKAELEIAFKDVGKTVSHSIITALKKDGDKIKNVLESILGTAAEKIFSNIVDNYAEAVAGNIGRKLAPKIRSDGN